MSPHGLPQRAEHRPQSACVGDEDDESADTEEDGAAVATPCGEEVDEAEEADEEPEVAA